MEILTSSRAKCYRACKRRHQIEYELGYRPRMTALPLSFGSLIHVGLEAWWLAIQEIARSGDTTIDCLDRALMAINNAIAELGDDDHEVDEYVVETVKALMMGYHYRWYGWARDPSIDVLGVEAEFSTPLVNPETGRPSRTFELAGKLDLLLRIDGNVWIAEHKTSSDDITPGSMYWQRLRIDGQVSTYYEGAAQLGHEVIGCLYDVLKKPGLRPYTATPEESRKWTKGKGCKECDGSAGGKYGVSRGWGFVEVDARGGKERVKCEGCNGTGWKEAPRLHSGQRTEDETPEQFGERVRAKIADDPNAFYQHGDVVRLQPEIDEFRADMWSTARSIREERRMGSFPRNPDACYLWGRFCAFWDVCCSVASLDDMSRYVRGPIHRELRQTGVLDPQAQQPKEEATDE